MAVQNWWRWSEDNVYGWVKKIYPNLKQENKKKYLNVQYIIKIVRFEYKCKLQKKLEILGMAETENNFNSATTKYFTLMLCHPYFLQIIFFTMVSKQ